MAASTWYVDTVNGNDGNGGTSWVDAKKTILGARAVTSAWDLVLIAPGVYTETYATWNSAGDQGVLYKADPTKSGIVIVDFQNSASYNGSGGAGYDPSYWLLQQGTRFEHISFRNPYTGVAFISFTTAVGTVAGFYHCCFYQKDGTANTGVGITAYFANNIPCNVYNNTFYNLAKGCNYFTGVVRNNYLISVTEPMRWMANTDYNAYAGNVEANGINTSTGANPGVRDASAEDFRLDPSTTPADYATFMSGGEFADRIGANGRGGLYYSAAIPQLRYLAPDPLPAAGNPQPLWENEGPLGTNTYTAGTPGDIIEDSTTKEPKIDLATYPSATGGRMRSDVMDLGSASPNLDELALAASEDLPGGAAIDTNTTLPQYIEYRSSSTAFAKGDVTPSWVAASRYGEYVNQAHRYFQIRVEFRTDFTNV